LARQAKFGERAVVNHAADQSGNVDQLARLRDEWVAQQERDALPLGIAAVKELLREGLIRVGDAGSGGFTAWVGSTREIESRVDAALETAEYPVLPGHLFWIVNTPLGDERAAG
jgi:hypothetical protein